MNAIIVIFKYPKLVVDRPPFFPLVRLEIEQALIVISLLFAMFCWIAIEAIRD